MTAEQNLVRLGIELPTPPAAVANYVAWVRSGNLIVTSGQLPWVGAEMKYEGRCGAELSDEEGYAAARLCAINAIAQLRDAVGDLERVAQLVRLEGNVHSASGYRGQPQVLNGASDLMMEVFEERGRHTRSALGVAEMPLSAAVQLSVWAELQSE
jgi:enamine deaminase RidA (YjgF/YER057c/UK114 family)